MIKMDRHNQGESSKMTTTENREEESFRGFQLVRQTFGPPDEIEQKIIDTIIEIDAGGKRRDESEYCSSSSSTTPTCSPRADSLYLNRFAEPDDADESDMNAIFLPQTCEENDDDEIVTLTPIQDELDFPQTEYVTDEWAFERPSNIQTLPESSSGASGSVLRTHSPGGKKYSCDRCDKAFVRPAELSRHIRTHTNERPFKCATCGQKFKRMDHLKSHETKHTKLKDHKCILCAYRTNRKDTLKRHMKNRHKTTLTEATRK